MGLMDVFQYKMETIVTSTAEASVLDLKQSSSEKENSAKAKGERPGWRSNDVTGAFPAAQPMAARVGDVFFYCWPLIGLAREKKVTHAKGRG